MAAPDTDVDVAALSSSLSSGLSIDVVDAEVLHDGLNLSIAISTADAERPYVLRQPRKLRQTELFNDLETEYEVLRRLEETPVPAPVPIEYCDDETVLGNSCLLMSHLDGTAIPLGSGLPERFQSVKARTRFVDGLIEMLAEIHTVSTESFEEVCDQQTPLAQVNCGTQRLDAARSVTDHEPLALREVEDWLRKHVPSNPQPALVHGDFRPGNVHFVGDRRPEITGVLDWETAFLGDPRTEIGYLLLRWGTEKDLTPKLDELEGRYSTKEVEQVREDTDDGLVPFTNPPGGPSRRDLIARYEAETGITFENDRFYRAHAAFMLATVWEDLHRHEIEAGNESDWPSRIDYLSLVARSIIRGERQL